MGFATQRGRRERSVTKRHLLTALCAAAALAVGVAPAAAQSVPTGYQEYFVLGYEQHTWDMMDKVQNGEGGAQFPDGMNSVVTAAASADNQVIFYDHWEDGLEADLVNPVQASTLVIGDGNPANGDACDFNASPCGVDILLQGDFVNFASNAGLGAGCTVPSAQPGTYTELCSSVPVNPRCAIAGACSASEVHFDGGDLILTSGGPLSVVHSEDPLTQFIGGSTEMLSRQAVSAARSYSVPVGEDLYIANTVWEPFHYVDLNLVAFEDNTQVFVVSPGAGSVSFTLNRGEHWSSLGFIDDGAFDPALSLTINAGTKVSTSGPITGLLFTGGDGTWATRHYALLPDILHSTDYVITAPGDDPAVGPSITSRPLDIYILNPDPFNSITVAVVDSVGQNTVVIPANSVVSYFEATGRFVPSDSTVRLTSNRSFWGISAYDYNTNISDWGHSWLATRFLTENYTVSFAPGDLNASANLSGIYVAATQDNTRVQFDLDGDGTPDVVDLDGGGPDPAPLPNNTYVVNALQSLLVFDPNDFDNTGTRILANKPVAVAWGQETDLTGFGDTALDTGYTVYPTNQLFLDPVLVIDKETDTTSVPTAGGVVTYTLTVQSFDFGGLTNLQIYDVLPTGVAGSDYVPGSTLVTYPNLTQDTTDPVASIDPTTGRDRLDWALSPDTLGTNATITVRYSIAIPAGAPGVLMNVGHAEAVIGGSTFSPTAAAQVVRTDILFTKSSTDDGSPSGGETMTFTLNVTNGGAAAETNVVVSDPIPPDTTFNPGSIVSSGPFTGSYDPGQNAVVWTAASFPVGGPHALSFAVTINPTTPSGTVIRNRGGYESDQTPYFLSNEVEPVVVGPDLVVAKSGPALLHPNEVGTFEITVRNDGGGAANNLLIADAFPLNTTYVTESMEWSLNAGFFTSVTDAADGDEGTATVSLASFQLASLGPGQDLTFRFRFRVNAGTTGQFVNNQASVRSDELSPMDTNLVQVPVVGDANVTGHVFLDLDGDGTQDPGEPDLANVDVVVTDSSGQAQIATTDANGDWIATVAVGCYLDRVTAIGYSGSDGAFDWSATSWLETSDDGSPTSGDVQALVDPLGVLGNSFRLNGDPVSNTRALSRQVDVTGLSTATLSFDYRRSSLESNDSVSIEVSYDGGAFATLGSLGNGTDATWQSQSFSLTPGLPASQIVVRFRTNNFNFFNDEFYFDNVAVCSGTATADVVDTDPDIPNGAILSTGNDPQTVAVVSGGTVATTPVGYEPLELTFTKVSDAPGGQVTPGQRITYTLTLTNNTASTQTGVAITDPLPAGTAIVPGSTQVSAASQSLRVTEYYLGAGTFGGSTHNLTLAQDLASDYFVILQGSDGDTSGGGDRGPDENYAALTADPFGTGDLGASGGTDVLTLTRGGSVDDWVGVVTVVECLGNCATAGFSLLDVERVVHGGAATSGSDTSGTPWTDLSRVMLMGGFNGAGCDTSAGSTADTKVCHVRLSPSGVDQIDWTRDGAGGATLSTATSTVMAVQWGSEWTVQRVNVTGTNGGDGVDATGEYNTAAIGSVPRAQTWVWGTGHTDDNGIGDAAEGVVVTLGDGVNQNVNETSVAVATEFGGTAVDFEVWALTHADLAVAHAFVNDGGGADPDGDTGDLTVDVTVASATVNRMGLSYNSQNGTGTAYPRPFLSARYLNDTTVRLERRRSGQPFAAWVQGIDFSQVGAAGSLTGGDPPNLVVPGDGITIAPGATVTVIFQVDVLDPLAPAITQIINTATAGTIEQPGPFVDSVTDTVVRPSVVVEPNNAGFVLAGGSRIYSHNVVNTSTISDSFTITGGSELGWPVELLDPATGAVIATDLDGNGVWDGGVTINTGTLAPGGFVEYLVRVTAPGATPVGTEDTTRLVATSDLSTSVSAAATDETTVLDGVPAGQIVVTPDNSGIVQAGGSIAYSHVVINNTGGPDTIDLLAETWDITVSPGVAWPTTTIHWDTNGDGVYTAGTDLQITNTAQLPNGGTQLIFVVVTAPAGAQPGDFGVTYLTATSRADNTLFGAATDTTTVFVDPEHDLSGGGSRVVAPGDVSVHPGTLVNLGDVDDDFNLSISTSNLYLVDGLLHPTELWVDTNDDGVPDTFVASDTDGDGTWDVVAQDANGDGLPDVPVPAGGLVAYELRRAVDLNQEIQRDHVTLTSQSVAFPTAEPDNVTATWIFAAVTRAAVRGVRVDPAGEVAFVTVSQVKTRSFRVYQTNSRRGRRRQPLHDEPVLSPVPDSLTPILYRVATRPVTKKFVMIKETETDGDVLWKGPFAVGNKRLRRAFDVVEQLMDRAGLPRGPVQWNRNMRPLDLFSGAEGRAAVRLRKEIKSRLRKIRLRARRAAFGVKIEVRGGGLVEAPVAALEAAGLPRLRPGTPVYLTHRGLPVRFRWQRGSDNSWNLAFRAAELSTDYSDTNVYVVTAGGVPRTPSVPLTVSGSQPIAGFHRVEKSVLYIPSLPEGPDPWQWDMLFSGWPWPDPGWDPTAGDFDLPDLAPGATGEIPLRIRVVGYTEHRHSATASINGFPVGSVTFDGAVQATLEGTVQAETLLQSGNTLSITYVGTDLPGSPPESPMAYLDHLDIAIPLDQTARRASFELVPWTPGLPELSKVKYLIITHPLFLAQAERLAALKTAEGLRTAVVETETAYDRFSGGIVEPLSIKALIRRAARASGRLQYVLLIGDDTFDPRDYVGIGSQSFVPSLYGRDATWGLVPSETPYADVDGDGRPDVAIGRLPVQSVAEAVAVVDKIATQSATLRALAGTQLAVVDNSSETDAPFRVSAEEALALLPESRVVWSDLDQGSSAARDAIFRGWQEGAMLTHFFGHGGPTEWADERILTHEDIQAHGSTWQPTVLFTWACLSQWHVGLFGTALNEALLLEPGGGALASFGPAGITPPARQAILVGHLYRELAQPGVTLGEAIRRAKNAAIEEDPNAREVIEGFNLFGDPALRLPWAPPAPQ